MSVLQYLTGGAAAIFALLVYMFQKRGQKIQGLETQLKMQPGQIQIDQIDKEVRDVSAQADKNSNDYDTLKRANAELAAKLGIIKSDPGRDSTNN